MNDSRGVTDVDDTIDDRTAVAVHPGSRTTVPSDEETVIPPLPATLLGQRQGGAAVLGDHEAAHSPWLHTNGDVAHTAHTLFGPSDGGTSPSTLLDPSNGSAAHVAHSASSGGVGNPDSLHTAS